MREGWKGERGQNLQMNEAMNLSLQVKSRVDFPRLNTTSVPTHPFSGADMDGLSHRQAKIGFGLRQFRRRISWGWSSGEWRKPGQSAVNQNLNWLQFDTIDVTLPRGTIQQTPLANCILQLNKVKRWNWFNKYLEVIEWRKCTWNRMNNYDYLK